MAGSSNYAEGKKKVQKKVVVRRTVGSAKTTRNHSNNGDAEPSPVEVVNKLFRTSLAFRIFLLELPILVLLACTLASDALLYVHRTYIHEYLKALEFTPERMENEETFPRMECQISDLTTLDPADLILGGNETYVDATEKVLMHGAALFPQMIQPETAAKFRKYVQKRIKRLKQSENVYVIQNDYRTSFTLTATEDPIVAKALQEIGTNERFVNTLEYLLGPDPSLMEFQVIAVSEGAEPQYLHADTPPRVSAIQNAYTFTPLYSFLLQLQDTYPEMGPTDVCPGSHRCFYTSSCYGFGKDDDKNTSEQVAFQAINPSKGYWETGTGLLYSSSIAHRGTGHWKGPQRVAVILSFAGRPDYTRPSQYSRFPPLDSVYAIRWHQMGHSLSDLTDPYSKMTPSLTRWTGLFNDHVTPTWNSFRFDMLRAANEDQYRFRVDDIAEQKEQVKGLMGTLSAIFFVDARRGEGYTDTEYHAKRLLERIRLVMFVAFLLAFILYMVLLSQTQQKVTTTLVRSSILATLLVICKGLGLMVVAKSDFATDVSQGDVMMAPGDMKAAANLSETYINSLPTPTPQDILVDKLPAKISAQAHLLDYLPGNRRWAVNTAKAVDRFVSYHSLPSKFTDELVEQVIEKTRTNLGHNFYERNEIGDFVELPQEFLLLETKRLMMQKAIDPLRRLGAVHGSIRCTSDSSFSLCSSWSSTVESFFMGSKRRPQIEPPRVTRKTSSFAAHEVLEVPPKSLYRCQMSSSETTANNSETWNVGDVAQIHLDREGVLPSSELIDYRRFAIICHTCLTLSSIRPAGKWVNAEIVEKKEDTFDLKAFDINKHYAKGVKSTQMRRPQIGSPVRKVTHSQPSQTQSAMKSNEACFRHLAKSRVVLLDKSSMEFERFYSVPDETHTVEVVFRFAEVGDNGGDLILLASNFKLFIGNYNPETKEDLLEGYFYDALGRVESLGPDLNQAKFSLPSTWFSDNELQFGLRASDGQSLKIYDISLTALSHVGQKRSTMLDWR